MFERISTSWALARSSWNVLMSNKSLILFPVFSGVASLLVLLSFLAPVLLIDPLREMFLDRHPLALIPIFIFYLLSYFVVIFFNSALVSCALVHFNGGEATVGDGLNAALNRVPQILAWAAVAATVGMILKGIESTNERVGRFISMLLGTAWTIMTFFVVPVLVVEKLGPFAAVGRSVEIMKRTWGESLFGSVGIGLFGLVLALPGIALFLFGGFLLSVSLALGLTIILLALVYFLVWGALTAALKGVFLSALYQFAANHQVPAGFDRDIIEHAFQSRAA
jgi:Family of unknown function (DUF6159)